jgi:hypothetical protein
MNELEPPPGPIERTESGWVQPDARQRKWYFFIFVGFITLIGAGLIGLAGLVVFFGLGAGF